MDVLLSRPSSAFTLIGMDAAGDPPEEAYGRVTDPERFRVLHDTAHRVLDELVERYEVTETSWGRNGRSHCPPADAMPAPTTRPI
ncbi:DUF6226 family protein [Actinoplanes sp. DH11]|uniref:DUF6226 family protein n=1 Tax=Actinoplanes sp. DH11 TaxID=2857011 RepID=UPI001E4F64D5|nr:DUF6226 family protein [Actinoplanes sp. DH11]